MNEQSVQKLPIDIHKIFSISAPEEFEEMAMQIYRFQYTNNKVYKNYSDLIGKPPEHVKSSLEIPFIPISFFKNHEIKSFTGPVQQEFHSSGTTGSKTSKHFVYDETIYQLSFIKGFEKFYGHIEDYIIIGLLPSYLENDHSSLIYMVDYLIDQSKDKDSGFFMNDYDKLLQIIANRKMNLASNQEGKKIILIGVSYALLDLAEKYGPDLSTCIVMETGGMKGRRKEITKSELHGRLSEGFGLDSIHSEYGMTELLSQAYSNGKGLFSCPPWMKIRIREYNDPFSFTTTKSGGINVIDLANIYSCSFIATQDLGKIVGDQFEVLGRFDTADIRGCNLLMQ